MPVKYHKLEERTRYHLKYVLGVKNSRDKIISRDYPLVLEHSLGDLRGASSGKKRKKGRGVSGRGDNFRCKLSYDE